MEITAKRLRELERAQRKLNCLEAGGVDNWEWDGEGLPPVGCECEYLFSESNQWRAGTCVAHHKEQAVMVDGEDQGAECCIEQRVRPLRTAAQRAEEEAVREMLAIVGDFDHNEGVCRALYRAGYRKKENNR